MKKAFFGMTDKGENASLYTLRNENGVSIKVSDYGATLQSLIVPGKDGESYDVVLGYDDLTGYEKKTGTFYGATIGRNSNRIGNASFIMNGQVISLEENDGKNNLHSGSNCYSYRMWNVKTVSRNSITFSLFSPDKDQGFSGAIQFYVRYTVTEENEVRIDYIGDPETDEDTMINLTNHSYFNLNGHNAGNILDHEVWINADHFLRTNHASIPTGEIVKVDNTPMDFRKKKKIGKDIGKKYEALIKGNGYDHNWCLKHMDLSIKAAELSSDTSGITMEVYTDLPGIQLYTGNYISCDYGKDKTVYCKRQGVCFETQFYPDAMNHDNFQSPVFNKNNPYRSTTIYKFIKNS